MREILDEILKLLSIDNYSLFVKRLAAAFIDFAIAFLISITYNWLIKTGLTLYSLMQENSFDVIVPQVNTTLYFFVFLVLTKDINLFNKDKMGQSYGKKILGIRLFDNSTKNLLWFRLLVHNSVFILLLLGQNYYFLVFVSICMVELASFHKYQGYFSYRDIMAKVYLGYNYK